MVCLDANEDIFKKSLGKSLTKNDGLNMSEVVGDFTGKKIGLTFFRGQNRLIAYRQRRTWWSHMHVLCQQDMG